MKKLILSILLLSSTCFSQYKLGWLGDDGKKPAPSLSPNQWPITVVADEVDLTSKLEDALDQGQIGSCVAHGTSEAYAFTYFLLTGKRLQLSRLQIYYDARAKEGTTRSDSGCQIVDAVNDLQRIGAGVEALWPYKTEKFTIKPPAKCYKDAKNHIAIKAFKVDNTDKVSIKLALTNGYPVVVGSLVYKEIMSLNKNNYILPMPTKGERPVGGHCYLIKQYKTINGQKLYGCRNSWSKNYGLNGDFFVPEEYIHRGDITEDCWVIRETTK